MMINKRDVIVEPIKIIKLVEEEHGVKVTERTRALDVVLARFMCIYFMRKYSKLSLNKIRAYFPITDHTTIINALRRNEDMMQTDDNYLTTLTKLDEELRAYIDNKNNVF